MRPTLPVQISQAKIAEFYQYHHICKLSLSGIEWQPLSPTPDSYWRVGWVS